jgi:hypothetical protein
VRRLYIYYSNGKVRPLYIYYSKGKVRPLYIYIIVRGMKATLYILH